MTNDHPPSVRDVRAALQRIYDSSQNDCRCEHDDENCCALTADYDCPYCIAAHALGLAQRSRGRNALIPQSGTRPMTDPNEPPSVRDVRALIEQWRSLAADLRLHAMGDPWEAGEHYALKKCAEELDALIGSAPQPTPQRATELCREALTIHPTGMIPIQAVWPMMLRLIGRDDVIAGVAEDWAILEVAQDRLGSAPQEQDWQPISTAPKNELLLLYRPGLLPADRIAVRRVSDWCGPKCCPEVEPTHWRPQPDPPVAAVDPLRGPQAGDPT